MKLEIEKAIKYPFKDPDWLKKVGIYAGFIILVSLLSSVLNLLSKFTGVLTSFATMIGIDQLEAVLVQIAPTLSLMLINMITFPINIYFSGYMIEITKNVMNKEELPLPEHTDLGYKFKLWLGTLITGLVPGILQLIILAIVFTPLILLTIFMSTSEPGGIMIAITILVWLVAGVIVFAVLIFINLLIVPTMQYLYLKNEDFSEILNISSIKDIISKAWKEMLLLTGILYILSTLGSLLATVLCFISFIVKPLVTILISLSGSHLKGQIFANLSQEDNNSAPVENTGNSMKSLKSPGQLGTQAV